MCFLSLKHRNEMSSPNLLQSSCRHRWRPIWFMHNGLLVNVYRRVSNICHKSGLPTTSTCQSYWMTLEMNASLARLCLVLCLCAFFCSRFMNLPSNIFFHSVRALYQTHKKSAAMAHQRKLAKVILKIGCLFPPI